MYLIVVAILPAVNPMCVCLTPIASPRWAVPRRVIVLRRILVFVALLGIAAFKGAARRHRNVAPVSPMRIVRRHRQGIAVWSG